MKKIVLCVALGLFLVPNMLKTTRAGDKLEILITDISGAKHHVEGNSPATIYYEIRDSSPKRWYRIRAHNIREVTFSKETEKMVYVSGLLNDGKTFEGIRPKWTFPIRGKGTLGSDVSIRMDKVRKIEYIKVEHYNPDEYLQYLQNLNWTVVDGNNQCKTNTLLFFDTYWSNTERISYNEFKVYDKFTISKAGYYGDTNHRDLPFLQGTAEIEMAPRTINYLEITGNLLDGKPEVLVKTPEGKSATLVLRMITQCDQANGWNPTYGRFDTEDYYVLDDVDFGKKAVSLVPLRRIVFKR